LKFWDSAQNLTAGQLPDHYDENDEQMAKAVDELVPHLEHILAKLDFESDALADHVPYYRTRLVPFLAYQIPSYLIASKSRTATASSNGNKGGKGISNYFGLGRKAAPPQRQPTPSQENVQHVEGQTKKLTPLEAQNK